MPRREGQKTKLLILLDIFTCCSDDEHPIGVPHLLELLAQRGIVAERKSIYNDIAALQEQGHAIELRRGRGGGYYLAEGKFELSELILLVDAVQASKFITLRKSQRLIEKLAGFASKYQANTLHRQVLVSGRFKSADERIYYWVDALHRAIDSQCQITFQYRDWNLNKELTERHGGKIYQVSPWALVWEHGNYYLIAWTGGELRHYRVDKMARVTILEDTPREGEEAFRGFDVTRYVQQMFDMFSGEVADVRLRCDNRLAGAMVDRFGSAPTFQPRPDGEHFDLTVTIQVSDRFLGWVAGFGTMVEIVGPDSVRQRMARHLAAMAAQYAHPAEE